MIYRKLTAADAAEYRAVRLHSLETEGKYFTADLAAERSRTLDEWAAACAETAQRVTFGAFQDGILVGISSADEHGDSVIRWNSTWVRPDLRRTRTAQTLYRMREAWSIGRGYHEAYFTIRCNNARSRAIQERHGGEQIGSETRRFADGSEAITLLYRRPLRVPSLAAA